MSFGTLLGVALSQGGFVDPYIGAIIGNQCDAPLQRAVDAGKAIVAGFLCGGTTNRLVIENHSETGALYAMFERYVVEKHLEALKLCSLEAIEGNISLGLCAGGPDIEDTYGVHHIRIRALKGDATQSTDTATVVSRFELTSHTATIDEMRAFVGTRCQRRREITTVYQGYIEYAEEKKKKGSGAVRTFWTRRDVVISKTMRNTVVAPDVHRDVFDDLANFMASESTYRTRGIPWTRGYLLYGPPGTGKTSIVKTCANEYKLPVFAVSLDGLHSTEHFGRLMAEVGVYASNSPYILALEDLDRSPVFDETHWDDSRSSVVTAVSGLLAELDGVTEAHGRILFITANNPERLRKCNALMRPGRIDCSIEVGYCTGLQVRELIASIVMLPLDNVPTTFEQAVAGRSITPAAVIQVMLTRIASVKAPDDAAKIAFLKHLADNEFFTAVSNASAEQIREAAAAAKQRLRHRPIPRPMRILRRRHYLASKRLKIAKKDITQIPQLEKAVDSLRKKLVDARAIQARKRKRERDRAKKLALKAKQQAAARENCIT